MRLHRKGIFIFILPFLALSFALAQSPTYYLNPNKKLTQYNTHSWTTENGLPTSSLLSTCQTSDGYLWISSYDGLIRFDGHEFKVFNKRNTEVFESNTIRKLAEDSYGVLWMTTQGNGLVSYEKGKFKRYGEELGINHLYRALKIDSENKIWSASPEMGWFYFQKGKFTFLKHTESLKNIEVRAIEQSKKGDTWFGTFGNGLYRYVDGKFIQYTEKDGLINNWVYSLFYDSEGTLWIGTSNGLCYFSDNNFHTYTQVGTITINDILEDKFNNLWLATNEGLFRKSASSGLLENLTTKNGLPHNFINDFLIDMEGSLWMAYYKGGLAQLKDGKFTNYTKAGGLHGKVVNAICELEPGKYLTAFDNGRLSIIENEKIQIFRLKNSLSGERIRHILQDSNKNLWFSTYAGLLKVSSTGKETWLNENTGFPQTKIRLTFEDSKGNIWVGTRNNGVIKINKNNTYTIFNASKGLSANLIMSIDEDNNGNILIGTSEGESGLNVISDNEIIKQYNASDGFLDNVIFNTYCDKEGAIWVATIGGLSCIRENKVTNFTEKNGLASDSPYDIIEDDFGNLWLPCSKGIMQIKKQELLDFSAEKGVMINCRLYTQHDGMSESECNPTTQSLKANNGLLLFPTIDGIAEIDPSNIPLNNYKPPVIIKQLEVDNELADIYGRLVFEPGIKRFTFNYTAINLYEPEKVEFKYRLEGFDDNWVNAGYNRSISYTNLKHGNYTFQVIASNNDGVWNTQGASISFTIRTKFVKTIWFYILIILLFLLTAYSIYRLRIQQLQKKQEELEKVIEKRTQEILEKNKVLNEQKSEIETQAENLESQKHELNLLNASKDKMFSIIAHDLRSPLGNFRTILDMMINTPEDYDRSEQEEMLKLLSQNAQSTYELLENLLNWSSSQRGVITYEPELLDISPVLDDILNFISPIAANKNISIISTIDEPIFVFADENMIRAILRNLIGNAIKFTRQSGEIQITFERKPNKVILGVKDNGIGIKPDIMDKLFNNAENTIRLGTNEEKGSGLGLLLCKEFVEKQGGKIWVESVLGFGTTFFFTLKTTKA
jgi:signal transduction histidine kinase/ligand-binding sensor domain-containing protein